MVRLILSVTFATLIFGLTSVARADEVPCESMLKALRTTLTSVKLSDADRAEVDELEAMGVARCDAHDNKLANVYLIGAIRVISMSPSVINPPT